MHIEHETNIDTLRTKAILLEKENKHLTQKVSKLMAEILALRGQDQKQMELWLNELNSELRKFAAPAGVTKPGKSEQLNRGEVETQETKKKQSGHGPHAQRNLQVIEEVFDVDEADKVCKECGGRLEEWSGAEDKSELIDVIERQFVIRKRVRKKYRCRCGACVETALTPPLLIPGGRYTPEFILESVIMKYLDNVPLHKQAQVFRREGLEVTRQTLWDHHWAFVKKMQPAIARLKSELFSEPVLGADESPWPFIQKGGETKWQAWALCSSKGQLLEIHPSKSIESGRSLLKGYSGKLIADGAPGYKTLSNELGFELINCWSHARRQVIKAEETEPEKVRAFLEIVAELFQIEEKAYPLPDQSTSRRGPPDYELLARLRDEESRGVVQRLQVWLAEQRALPESDLGKGIEYIAKRWRRLTTFLDDPKIPLTNNLTERGFIDLACGRRSFFGSRSARGAIAASVFYSLIGSAKLNGVEPKAYLRLALNAALKNELIPLPHELVATTQSTI